MKQARAQPGRLQTAADKRSTSVAGTSNIRITVVIQKRCILDTNELTGMQIKEKAGIPADFSLHRRIRGGSESIPESELVEVHDGDHFFAQPLSQAGLGHNEQP
jgi:hypothetical protein